MDLLIRYHEISWESRHLERIMKVARKGNIYARKGNIYGRNARSGKKAKGERIREV